jgi:DNA-binding NarL/FixJ family response regulator
MTRVLIADDQALVRDGFRMILEAEEGIEVVGEAADGLEAVLAARATNPDVILMDVRMPNVDGLEATRKLLERDETGARVLILTTFDLDEYVYEALRAGASGFLLKDTPPEQLVDAIRIVAEGDELLTPSVTCRIVSEFTHPVGPSTDAADLGELTADELELLRSVAAGLSNAEIASRAGIEETTVRERLNRVLAALQLRDRVHAVVFAHERGLVTADDCEDEPTPP